MAYTGTFTATGVTAAPYFSPEYTSSVDGSAPFNMSLWGTFVGTVQLERSFDNGVTFLPLTALGTAITFTAPATEVFNEPESGVQYRLNCTAFTSGTINYRLSQ